MAPFREPVPDTVEIRSTARVPVPPSDPGVDSDRLLALDTLVGQPRVGLTDVVQWIGSIDQRLDVLRRLRAGV